MTKIERLDLQLDDARKQLDKATNKRDDAIKALIRSDGAITKAARALGRISKRKAEAKQEARRARVAPGAAAAEPIHAL